MEKPSITGYKPISLAEACNIYKEEAYKYLDDTVQQQEIPQADQNLKINIETEKKGTKTTNTIVPKSLSLSTFATKQAESNMSYKLFSFNVDSFDGNSRTLLDMSIPFNIAIYPTNLLVFANTTANECKTYDSTRDGKDIRCKEQTHLSLSQLLTDIFVVIEE